MSDKKHWILKIVPAIAFTAGIIMASIGGIMTLSSSAKLVLFDHGPYFYVNREQCEYDYNNYIPVDYVAEVKSKPLLDNRPQKRSESEITKCLDDERDQEKKRFQQDKKQDIVDGLSYLLVGLILILSFRKSK